MLSTVRKGLALLALVWQRTKTALFSTCAYMEHIAHKWKFWSRDEAVEVEGCGAEAPAQQDMRDWHADCREKLFAMWAALGREKFCAASVTALHSPLLPLRPMSTTQ